MRWGLEWDRVHDKAYNEACSTMGIINSLPGRCNLAQVNCCKLYSEGRNSFISSLISVLSLLIDVFLWFVFMMQPLEP